MMLAFRAILATLIAAPAIAQEQLTPDRFLDLAIGKTLTFTTLHGSIPVGVEQFLRRDLSVWADDTGRCTYGRIELRGPLLCFLYEDAPDPQNCWLPFLDQGTLLVMSRTTREVQRVSHITYAPISCKGAPTS